MNGKFKKIISLLIVISISMIFTPNSVKADEFYAEEEVKLQDPNAIEMKLSYEVSRTDEGIKISWENLSFIDTVVVMRKSSNGVFEEISSKITSNEFLDSNIEYDETYEYKLYAYLKDGNTGETKSVTLNQTDDKVINKEINIYEPSIIEGATQAFNIAPRAADSVLDVYGHFGRSITYYAQTDSKWAGYKYPPAGTIKDAGCCPTSMAIALSTITKKNITPKDTADYAMKNGYVVESGTYDSFCPAIAKSYGVNTKSYSANDIDKVKQELAKGNKIAVAWMKNGHFTRAGHYIVLTGVEKMNGKNYFTVYDCNAPNSNYERNNYDGLIEVVNNSSKAIVKAESRIFTNECLSFHVFDVNENLKPRDTPKQLKPSYKVVGGQTRYDTANLISKDNFTSADTIVLVNGFAFEDGLGAGAIASFYKGPLLLTEKTYIPKGVKDEISRLKAKNAIIIGGTGVVGEEVENQLKELGVTSTTRIAGQTRYDTSLEIVKYIDKNCYDVNQVMLVEGHNGQVDGLSIASVAIKEKSPILLIEKTKVKENAYEWLKSESLDRSYIIGGTSLISNNVVTEMNKITKENISSNRISGNTRFQTNAKIIEKWYGNTNYDYLYTAKGFELVDALTISPVAGSKGAPIVILADYLVPEQKVLLEKKFVKNVVQAGMGIKDKAKNDVINALGSWKY